MESRGGAVEDVVGAVMKLTAAGLVLTAIGLPILETWAALFLGMAVLGLVFSDVRPGWRGLAIAAGITVALVAFKAVLPRADIAEAHNAFLVMTDGEPLERGLPPVVFRSWKAQFDELYPPDSPPYKERSKWRNLGVPVTLFTGSADAIWRKTLHTRQVDAIDFRTLGEFRGGFANDIQYNFWSGELLREWMPFYVMYDLTPASVGSSLRWNGQVFWERDAGRFEEIVHRDAASQRIEPADAGKRIYVAFFPKRGPFHFQFEPSLPLRVSAWAGTLATIVGIVAMLLLLVRPRWPSWLGAVSIFSGAYLVMMGFIAVSAGKYLGRPYPPQGGGDDGLVHDGWGHSMALLAGRGDIREALRGFEDVYWFTPGTRYVRMLEKLVFGDTNLLFALVAACVPVAIFHLIRNLAGNRWAWIATVFFCLVPAGNLSFVQYLANAKLGYGEAIAGGLFIGGLAVLLNHPPGRAPKRADGSLMLAGAALAASMFIRPNFALAVVWLAVYYAWAGWRQRAYWPVAALGAGLSLALWMPFHNWYYGHEFFLIARSGTSYSLALRPSHYLSAASDMLRGHFDTDAAGIVLRQLHGWLWDPGFVIRPELTAVAWALHILKIVALLVTCWTVARWAIGRLVDRPGLGVIAVAALLAHAPMLFTVTTAYRYAMLGWDLSLVVLIGWIAALWPHLATVVKKQRETGPHHAAGSTV